MLEGAGQGNRELAAVHAIGSAVSHSTMEAAAADDGTQSVAPTSGSTAAAPTDQQASPLPAVQPILCVGPMQRDRRDRGSSVRLSLSTGSPGPYAAVQNIRVAMSTTPQQWDPTLFLHNVGLTNREHYLYSEAFSLDATGPVEDVFRVPNSLRRVGSVYECVAEIWLAALPLDESFQVGTPFSADTPWGSALGREELSIPPTGCRRLRRATRIMWSSQSEILYAVESREMIMEQFMPPFDDALPAFSEAVTDEALADCTQQLSHQLRTTERMIAYQAPQLDRLRRKRDLLRQQLAYMRNVELDRLPRTPQPAASTRRGSGRAGKRRDSRKPGT